MDALHTGMESNPLPQYYGSHDGIKVGKDIVASKGFADDTVAMSGTLAGLARINSWVHAWIAFNHSELNASKTQLVGRRRNVCMINSSRLTVAGVLMEPVTLETPISYLGVQVSMNLDWSGTIKKMKQLVGLFASRILAYKLTLEQAITVINVYLIPKLDLSLHYANTSNKVIEELDVMIARCLAMCSRVARAIRGVTLSALTGVVLPSQHEILSKASECFIRLNSPALLSCRTGRLRWAEACAATTSSTSTQAYSASNRLVRVKGLADKVGFSLYTLPTRSTWQQHDLAPSGVALKQIKLRSGVKQSLAFDYVGEWGRKLLASELHAYTDGSSSAASSDETPTSSWGVCYGDDWFTRHYSSLPSDEKSIKVHLHLVAACTAGGRIDTTTSSGIFMAELQAIYRAMQSVPSTCSLTILTDSQAAVKAIETYEKVLSTRKRLRMIGRPLLNLIDKFEVITQNI
jgi:ribonuclease HI